MKKGTLFICIATAVCCFTMAAVDGILQPGYAVKSGIKIVLFLLVPLIFSAVFKLSVAKCLRPDRQAILIGSGLGLATFLIIIAAYWLLHSYIDLSAVPESLEKSAGVTKSNFLYVSTYIALCNSLLEEFFFRGFVSIGLSKTATKPFAYIFSAAAFAIYHAGMLFTMVSPLLFVLALAALFLCGLLFHYLNAYRQRIWVSWLVHMGANLAINSIGMLLLGIF